MDFTVFPRFKSSLIPSTSFPRAVSRVVSAPKAFEGEGFPVRRAFAGLSHAELDPFIHMDQMGEVEYAPGEPKGTPWHPHRGFETFTYLLNGRFVHQDSNGGGGIIEEGGTQYMTAGDGILHIETPPEYLVMSGGLFHGVQLWINLPRKLKRIKPQYQDLQDSDTVFLTDPAASSVFRVLAGDFAGLSGPGISHTPLSIVHVSIPPAVSIDFPWPSNFNALVYVLSGSGFLGSESAPVSVGQTAVLASGDFIRFRSSAVLDSRSSFSELFVIGGVPLREPVHQYGPFVMNTKSEVLEAFEDFQKGRFGIIPPNAIQPFRAR